MAQNVGMGVTPVGSFQPPSNPDLYILGLSKLQKEFRTHGLERFRPYTLGKLHLRDQMEIQRETMETNENGLNSPQLGKELSEEESHVGSEDG